MPEDPINPFQSPQATADDPSPVVSATTDEHWPFEATELAVIEAIDPPWGRPISPGKPWSKIFSYLALGLVLLYAIWIGLMLLIAWLTGNTQALADLTMQHVPTLLFIVLPAVLFLLTISRHYFHQDFSTFRRLAKLIRQRETSPIESLNSPNCQFVAIVPRDRWQLAERDLTQEVAVLHINPYESRIVLEGAEHRFWIPSRSLLKCGVDSFTIANKQTWVIYMVVRTKDGPQEICLQVGNVDGFWQSSIQRKSVAEKYWGRIMLLKQTPPKEAKGE